MSTPGGPPRTPTPGDDRPAPDPPDRPPPLRDLDPRAASLWRMTSAGRGALALGLAVAVELVFDLPVPFGAITVTVAVLAAAAAAVVPGMKYRAWGFALRDRDVYLRHGILFRTTSIVPHARIQHVDTRHGPIDRWFGLASVVIFTAGTRGAIIPIPGLDADEAEAVRDRLAAQSGVGDAV